MSDQEAGPIRHCRQYYYSQRRKHNNGSSARTCHHRHCYVSLIAIVFCNLFIFGCSFSIFPTKCILKATTATTIARTSSTSLSMEGNNSEKLSSSSSPASASSSSVQEVNGSDKNRVYIEGLLDNLSNTLDKWIVTGLASKRETASNIFLQIQRETMNEHFTQRARRMIQRAGLDVDIEDYDNEKTDFMYARQNKMKKELGKTDSSQRQKEAEQRKQWEETTKKTATEQSCQGYVPKTLSSDDATSTNVSSSNSTNSNSNSNNEVRSALSKRLSDTQNSKKDLFLSEIDPGFSSTSDNNKNKNSREPLWKEATKMASALDSKLDDVLSQMDDKLGSSSNDKLREQKVAEDIKDFSKEMEGAADQEEEGKEKESSSTSKSSPPPPSSEVTTESVAAESTPPPPPADGATRVAELVARAGSGSAFKGETLGIGGLDDVLAQVKRRVWIPMAAPPKLLKELGIHPVRGLLLYGKPGCGKTLLARTLGSIISPLRPITVVSGPEIMDKFVGSSEKNLREIFDNPPDIYDKYRIGERDSGNEIAKAALHIIIMDEFDAVARARGGKGGKGGDQGDAGVARDSVVNQLLAKMDGVDPLIVPTLVIGLTNKRSLIEPALLRSGRFEVQVEVPPPRTKEQRISILKVHMKSMYLAGRVLVRDAPPGTVASNSFEKQPADDDEEVVTYDELLEELAMKSDGMTGASLAGVARAAASHALERAVEEFSQQDMSTTTSSSMMECLVRKEDFIDAIHDIFESLGDSDYADDSDGSDDIDDSDDSDGNNTDDKNDDDNNDNAVAQKDDDSSKAT